MDIKYRRTLYIVATLVFLAVVPLLIMYALGITYNGKKHKIEYEGGVYLKFEPKNATVTIDGTSYNKQSPFELTTLYPGTHQIHVSTPGYHSWSKTIRVEPRQTVTFPSIVLFPITLPERTDNDAVLTGQRKANINTAFTRFTILPSAQGLTIATNDTLASTTIPLATSTLQFMVPGTETALLYDETSKRLALVDGSRTSLSTHIFESVERVSRMKSMVLFWTPFELWVIQNNNGSPELITRVSEGISSAVLLDDSYAAFATKKGSVYVSELTSLFGRTIQLLTSFSSIDSISSDGAKVIFIHGALTETSELGWFSLRLKQ